MRNKFKKLLSLLIFALMLVFPHETASAETVLYNDSNVSIAYMGIEKETYGDGYDINLVAENFSNRNLNIYVNEMSINEYMVNDPTCFIEISPGKKSRGSINIWGNDAKQNPIGNIKEIEVKFRIFDDNDDDFGYESNRIRLRLTSNSSSESSQGNSGSNGSSQNQQSVPFKTITAKACKGFPSKVNVPASLSQNLSLRCSDGCDVLCTRIGQSYISDGTGSYSAQVYKMVFSKSGTHTVTAYDLFGNAVSAVIAEVSEDHSYETFGKTITRPTCTEEGITEYTCNVCGFKTIETEPATGHNYNNGVVTKKPTCVESGTKTYTCTKCKDSYTEEVRATGEHSFSDWEISEEPTALEEGEETRTCLSCGKEENRMIEKLDAYVVLSKNKIRIKNGKKFILKIKDKTYGDYVKNWKASNKNIVSLEENENKCTVKALKTGETEIILTMESGCTETCLVIVEQEENNESVTIRTGRLSTSLIQKSNDYYKSWLKNGKAMTHKVKIAKNSITIHGNLEYEDGRKTGYAKYNFKKSKNIKYLLTGGDTKGQKMAEKEFKKYINGARDSGLGFILEFKNGKIIKAIIAS